MRSALEGACRVGTVDSFQGQETDLVVFSATRSNAFGDMGFLRDPRRLCVAITRARRGLILVGDAHTLRSSHHWRALLESCEARGCLVDAEALYGDLRLRKEELERQIDAASGAGEYGRANQLLEEQRQVEDQLKASGADVDPAKAAWLAKREQGMGGPST